MSKFIIEISSVPDKENLVAEIWHNEILVAEINQETERFEIELYQSGKNRIDLAEFLQTIESAKRELAEE